VRHTGLSPARFRKSGDDAARPGANFHLAPIKCATECASAKPIASANNEACYRKKKIAVAMATAINQADATFANRTNRSPLPTVRNVVALGVAVFFAMQRAATRTSSFQKSFSCGGKPRVHPGFPPSNGYKESRGLCTGVLTFRPNKEKCLRKNHGHLF
jgi:hypothetical protein